MSKPLTIDQINIKLEPRKIKLLERTKSKGSFQCLDCGHVWLKRIDKVLYDGYGCKQCYRSSIQKENKAAIKQQERLEKLKSKDITRIDRLNEKLKNNNRNIIVLSIEGKRAKVRCLKCDLIWNKKIQHIHENRAGCPECNKVTEYDAFDESKEVPKEHRTFIKKRARYLAGIIYKGGKCKICNIDLVENPYFAVFHHINPNTKENVIGELICKNWNMVCKELKECDLLCHNCHNRLHGEMARYDAYLDIIKKLSAELINRTNKDSIPGE